MTYFNLSFNVLFNTIKHIKYLGVPPASWGKFLLYWARLTTLKKKNSKNPPLKKLVLISFTLSCPYTCKDSILDSNLRTRILRIFKLLPENYSAMSVSILYNFQQISMKESFKKLEKPYFEGLF